MTSIQQYKLKIFIELEKLKKRRKCYAENSSSTRIRIEILYLSSSNVLQVKIQHLVQLQCTNIVFQLVHFIVQYFGSVQNYLKKINKICVKIYFFKMIFLVLCTSVAFFFFQKNKKLCIPGLNLIFKFKTINLKMNILHKK